MINKKDILLSILSFVFVLQVQSQNIIKKLNNKTFTSKIGYQCEETPDDNPCAGLENYLYLKFNKKKITITEMHISSCDYEIINYQLEYEWELINNKEIKIHYKPEEIEYKSIKNMKFKMIDDMIFGYKKGWNNKLVEYKFIKYHKK